MSSIYLFTRKEGRMVAKLDEALYFWMDGCLIIGYLRIHYSITSSEQTSISLKHCTVAVGAIMIIWV